MTEHFQSGDRSTEFGRTVGDARRLAKAATYDRVIIETAAVRTTESRDYFGLSRRAFLAAIRYRDDGDDLVSHMHIDDDGTTTLFVGSAWTAEHIRKLDAAKRAEAAAA